MANYDDDYEIDNDNEYEYLDEEQNDLLVEDEVDILNDNTNNNNIKILTYENVLENISNTKKKTIPFLTKFEKARIMGVRIQQLANGAKPRINIDNLKNINEIVEKELEERKIPFIIRRRLPNGKFEDWKLEEFESV